MITVFVFILNVTMDPLQVYRPNPYAPLQADSRYQNAGRLNSLRWTDLLVGTSLSENFSPKLANHLFGGKFINVSMPGSSIAQQDIVIQHAYSIRAPKMIVWGIDIFAMAKPEGKEYWREVLPAYLYNKNIWDDAPYLFSRKTAEQSWAVLKNRLTNHPVTNDPDLYNNWHASARYSAEAVWGNYANFPELVSPDDNYALARFKENFSQHIEPLLKAHPGTEFHLVFLPHSLPYCAGLEQLHPNSWSEWGRMKHYLLELKELYPNLHLYDFQDRFDWIKDYTKYKDTVHFHQDYSDAILKSVQDGEEMTDKKIDSWISELKREIEAMRAPSGFSSLQWK
ncbi:MAG: SGNH/GDSL hydrolase family protein [Pontiellaceae bacterium]|nr:SGNH/GDSL hydrolase family protein [Pontiellaceae bacterium]